MKQILLLVFLFISSISFSQLEVGSDHYTSTFDVAETYDVKTDITLVNTSSDNALFVWKIEIVEAPPVEWGFYLCDLNKCYPPGFDEASEANTMASGQNAVINFHVTNGGVVGIGVYDISFINPADDSVIVKTRVTVGEISVDNKEVSPESNVILYPNPVQNSFSLDGNSENVKEIAIFNILGKSIKTFNASDEKEFYVGDLTNGRYFVRLIDSNGQSLKVLRLLKQGI